MLVPGGPLIQGVSVMSGVLILIILGNNNNCQVSIGHNQERIQGVSGEGCAGVSLIKRMVFKGPSSRGPVTCLT